MGGGHHYHYPKWVWSPAGGWWPKPANWRANTMMYGVVMASAAAWLYVNATPKTVAYIPRKQSSASNP